MRCVSIHLVSMKSKFLQVYTMGNTISKEIRGHKRSKPKPMNVRQLMIIGYPKSGKTTIFQCLHKSSFNSIIIQQWAQFQAFKIAYLSLKYIDFDLLNSNQIEAAQYLLSQDQYFKNTSWYHTDIPSDVAQGLGTSITILWETTIIRRTINALMIKSDASADSLYHIFENIGQYFNQNNNLEFNDSLVYCPSTGIGRGYHFIDNNKFIIHDVTLKYHMWANAETRFNNTEYVIFVAGLNDYFRKLRDNNNVYHLSQTLELFKNVVKYRHFRNKKFIVICNKLNRFRQCLKYASLKECFSDYEGPTYQQLDHRVAMLTEYARPWASVIGEQVPTELLTIIVEFIMDDPDTFDDPTRLDIVVNYGLEYIKNKFISYHPNKNNLVFIEISGIESVQVSVVSMIQQISSQKLFS